MKTKPTKHKEDNTFKFVSFSDRLLNVDFDVIHRIGHKNEEDEDDDYTHCYKCLTKWDVINLTKDYEDVRKDLPCIQTLPLLINQKEKVISVILKHLAKPSSYALPALLELLAALAKDLRHEICKTYGDVLQALVPLLSAKDADILEYTFTCLAYFFKYLWKYFVKDFTSVFKSVVPLFSDDKPSYINNFAAESFAFLARKVKDKEQFIRLVVKTVGKKSNSIEGCGRLLFQVIKGIQMKFHSCASDVLRIGFGMLYDENIHKETLHSLLSHMVAAMCTSIKPEEMKLFWTSCYHALFKNIGSSIEARVLNLKLISQVVDYKSGLHLLHCSSAVDLFIDLVPLLNDEVESSLELAEIGASILQSNVKLTQEKSQNITQKLLAVPSEEVQLSFVYQSLHYSGFEMYIVPWIEKFSCAELSKVAQDSSPLNEAVLHLLAKVILTKAPPCQGGSQLQNWKQYPLDLTRTAKACKSGELKHNPLEVLIRNGYFASKDFYEEAESIFCLLIILPHVKITDKELILGRLKEYTMWFVNEINEYSSKKGDLNEGESAKLELSMFSFYMTIEVQVHMLDVKQFLKTYGLNFIINTVLPYVSNPKYVSMLYTLDLFLTFLEIPDEEPDFVEGIMQILYSQLLKNVSAPHSVIRLLTTHILSLMAGKLNIDYLAVCHEMESVPLTIHDYRQKLRYMEKLSYDAVKTQRNDFIEIPLRSLIGTLYNNFQLVWKPAMDGITTFAKGWAVDKFWTVLFSHLSQAADNACNPPCHVVCGAVDCEFLDEFYSDFHSFNDKPDFHNFRIMLWNSFSSFPEICDFKSEEVTNLFTNMYRNEFCAHERQTSWNIKQKSEVVEETLNMSNCSRGRNKKTVKKRTPAVQTLVAHLSVFAKVKNPKSLHNSAELKTIYSDLLTEKMSEVQKAALNCLFAYKPPYLVAYRDNMYQLLDDKALKSVLTVFSIDKESSVIHTNHRQKLIPLVMRLLFGRMSAKNEARRTLILRFLMGCEENEMLIFVELLFQRYSELISEETNNPEKLAEKIMSSVDLTQVPSLRTLQSSLYMLRLIIDNVGSLMGDKVLSYLLTVLLRIGAVVQGILSQRSEVYTGFLPLLRTVRVNCTEAVNKFFSQFENFAWDTDTLNTLFNVFVWPYLAKLPHEGIHSPTALLKLFSIWSQNPRYFPLFVKHAKGDTSVTPLPFMMTLLVSEKAHFSVTKCIMDITERLLTTDESETQNEVEAMKRVALPSLPVEDQAVWEEDESRVNYGSCVLMPHFSAVLDFLKGRLSKQQYRGLSARDLAILSHICELSIDPTMSKTILDLLLPSALKKAGSSEHTATYLIATLHGLLKHVPDPYEYLRALAPLFGVVSAIGPRKLLCELLVDISYRCDEKMKQNAQLVADINAFDAKWVEQPDFNRRLDGFKHINECIKSGDIMADFGIIIIQCCFHQLRTEKDLSLRDSSSHCLQNVAPALCLLGAQQKDGFITKTIIRLTSRGIQDKASDIIRYEAIALLGNLVRKCADVNVIFADLLPLANKEDPEVDFFNNLNHLQSHRKTRALLRFAGIFSTLIKPPHYRTLVHFLLPLISSFLCSEKYAKKNSVIDGAINAIGVLCKLLSWRQYYILLRYYLHKLHSFSKYQKQLIRVVTTILDSFHFDIECSDQFKGNEVVDSVDKELQGIFKSVGKQSSLSGTAEKRKSSAITDSVTRETSKEVEKEKTVESHDKTEEEEDTDDEEDGGDKEEGEGVDNEEKNEDDKSINASASELEASGIGEDELDDKIMEMLDQESPEESAPPTSNTEPAVNCRMKLTLSAANNVVTTIVSSLVPELLQTVGHFSRSELSHKRNRKLVQDQGEEDIMRIPLLLPVVKLLHWLPPSYRDQTLPGIFMRLCTFLKSRLDSVRRTTRETLEKIMVTLGPGYLQTLLHEMMTLLTKGFHVHVLIHTIHAVMSTLKNHFKSRDMDGCLSQVLEICQMDLFGKASEEKDVAKIVGKIPEARGTKTYYTLHLAAQFITEPCLVDILIPFKKILSSSSSLKVVQRVSECLRHLVLGLVDNEYVSVTSLLVLAYGTASQKIASLQMKNKQQEAKSAAKAAIQRPDSLLIPRAPRNRFGAMTVKPCTSASTNAHLLVEFGLNLCHTLMKRGKIVFEEMGGHLDPLVPILKDNLSTKEIKLTTVSLKCLSTILKMDLPSLKQNVEAIAASIFQLLHKYGAAGLSKGEYFDMVVAAFKAVTVLVRDVKMHLINMDQLKALLLYVEQDMQDHTRHATAFTLLKAILSRKLQSPEIDDVMGKVSRLSIQSEFDHVRVQARQVLHQYLMNYPLGDKIDKHIQFFLTQLAYEITSGRKSALNMIHTMIITFPDKLINRHSGLFLASLGTVMVNDDNADCKELAAKIISALLSRVPDATKQNLFDIMFTWMKTKKVINQCLAVQLCGIFVENEKNSFKQLLSTALPEIINLLTLTGSVADGPGKFVKMARVDPSTKKPEAEHLQDHLHFLCLRLINKICSHCPLFLKDSEWREYVENVAETAEFFLAHPHEWVRLEAAVVLSNIFASLDVREVALAAAGPDCSEGSYLFKNTRLKLKTLILDFSAQLQPETTGIPFIKQVVMNLVFLCKVIQALPNDIEELSIEGDLTKLSLTWIIRRMRRIINQEIVQAPTSFILREAVFRWIVSLIRDLNQEKAQKYIPQLLAPATRELLNEETSHPEVLKLAREISKLLKGKVGMDTYTQCLSKIQAQMAVRRVQRKKEKAQQVITEPEIAAKRKIKKQLRKKDQKKRKLDVLKGRGGSKRKRFKDLDDGPEELPGPSKWLITQMSES